MARSLAFASMAATLTLSACQGSSSETELAQGEATATVRGALQLLDSDPSVSTTMRAILVWTYWPEANCVTSGDSPEEISCSGALLATEAALVEEGGHFVLSVTEPPPDFVHGFDVATAEAFVAIVPTDADLETTDFTNPDNRIGLSTDYVVLYAPTDFAADTVEAALVGGPLGAGFHLIAPLEEGPQFEVVLDNGNEVISTQRGMLAPSGFDTEIAVTPGAEYSPWLGL